jgi:hypothetical protein
MNMQTQVISSPLNGVSETDIILPLIAAGCVGLLYLLKLLADLDQRSPTGGDGGRGSCC